MCNDAAAISPDHNALNANVKLKLSQTWKANSSMSLNTRELMGDEKLKESCAKQINESMRKTKLNEDIREVVTEIKKSNPRYGKRKRTTG